MRLLRSIPAAPTTPNPFPFAVREMNINRGKCSSSTLTPIAVSRRPPSLTQLASPEFFPTKPGIVGSTHTLQDDISEIPLAIVGIVPCRVSAENGPIRRGDLLVTSSTPGHAMRATDRSRMTGAIVGKALQNLDSGAGVIEILVSLQ